MHAFKNYPCLTADGLFLLDKFFRTANLKCHIFEHALVKVDQILYLDQVIVKDDFKERIFKIH